ncbi:MAG: hypothetical protein COS49_00745 [Candidatus Portnoybacteria bacterium CG03_land_8_20_14_0_80_41_10]|uniref:Inositolphosphotransferase Aur1/Ipt1 domain-containing protein n=1 Tax=Candidatus Portnoybacteria bacterium CG03_land_8_20_14_0_80_41_10 TaxID=1974808 RepID=A0A2M7BV15_9BACT|nr:MAG: hypothetical protein COS49_00745 [Candidatus Portnoybacteria bacterium CG03_land_8_20_14_0_80_41_10]
MPKGLRVRLPPSAPLMSRIKNILRSIRIEEYILFIFSIMLFLSCLIFSPQLSWLDSFRNGFGNVILGIKYFLIVFVFAFYYIFFKLYLYLIHWLSPFINKEKSLKILLLTWLKGFSQSCSKIKNNFLGIFFFLRPVFPIVLFFTLVTFLIGLMAFQLKDNLVDDQLMKIDKSMFGSYPFFWLQNPANFLRYLAPLFLYSFSFLGLLIGISWLFLFLNRSRKFFSQYVIATTLVIMISLPFWFLFPANSPQNAYLNNVYSKEIDSSIKKSVEDYRTNEFLLRFYENVGVKPGDIAPVTTMPSLHVAWAIIIVYYLFKFRKKTVYFTLPWATFSSLGAVYLGQHYFIDVLVSLPVAFIAIGLTGYLFKIEKRYYRANRLDKQEESFKEQIKKDLALIPKAIRSVCPGKKVKSF